MDDKIKIELFSSFVTSTDTCGHKLGKKMFESFMILFKAERSTQNRAGNVRAGKRDRHQVSPCSHPQGRHWEPTEKNPDIVSLH